MKLSNKINYKNEVYWLDLIKLGNVLKNKRDELELSLRDAGNLIGISHNYLSILEKAKDPRSQAPITPTIDTLKLISDAYNLDINELLALAGYTDITIVNMNKFYSKANPTNEDDAWANKIVNDPIEVSESYERYQSVHDVEKAMRIILKQPGLMLKGELLSDESKIILANAIQMGLRTAEELEKKKNKGDINE